MLHAASRSSETRHSYQSTTGTRNAFSALAALPQLLKSNSRHARQLSRMDEDGGGGVNLESLDHDLHDVGAQRVEEGRAGVCGGGGGGGHVDGGGGHSHGGGSGGSNYNSDSSSLNQLAMLYAIFLTLFGLVFPLSSSVRAHPFSDWYLCVFYIVLYSSGIAFLLFFMTWVMSRPSHKLFVENSAGRSGELVRLQETERPPPLSASAAAAAAATAGSGGSRVEFRIGRFSVSESNHNFNSKECQSLLDKDGRRHRTGTTNASSVTNSNGHHAQIELLEPEAPHPHVQEQQQQQQQNQHTIGSVTSSAAQGSQLGVTFDVQNSTQGSNLDTIGRQKAYMKRINSTLIQNAKELGVHEIQAYSVLSLQESHSPSFFLRIACFIFGALKVTHEFLHIVDRLTEVGNGCVAGSKAVGDLFQYALSIAFTVLQTFFIFKYSKVSVNIYQKVSVLGFMHLMAINMCVWFQAILLETGHNAHKQAAKALYGNGTNGGGGVGKSPTSSPSVVNDHGGGGGSAATNCSKEVFWRMAPYLFPFTIEYSLMAAFSCYVLYCNVGKFLDVIQSKGFNVGKKCLRNRKKSQTSFSASCYKSDKGFFLGALQMIVGIVSGIYFTIYVNDHPDDLIIGKYIYLSTDLVLLTLNLGLCIVAYRQMRALTLVQRMSTGPDAWLLGITLAGVLAFELFQLFGAFAEQGVFLALRVAQGIICILQSLFQVFLVLDGEKRRSLTSEAIEGKPGREMVAAVLLGNLAMWMVYTLEVREINSLPNYSDAYVLIASQIFSYVCSPLIIFFRFHSACCFVEIWRHSYKGRQSGGESSQQLHHQCAGSSGSKSRYPGSANSLAVAREISHHL